VGRNSPEQKQSVRIGTETITPQQLALLAASMMSQEEVGEILGVTQQAISKLLKKPAFRRAWDQARAATKQKLRDAQLEAALVDKDKTALIWLGKQYLGQRDSVKEIETKSDVQVTYIASWGGKPPAELVAAADEGFIEGEVEDEEEE
jgi:hypothetical protein